MSKRRGLKNRERALLIEGVFDDSRWEKLADGEATVDEAAELHAWAQQSNAAKEVWDVFRPATDAELDELTARVLQQAESRKSDRSGLRVVLTSGTNDQARHSDRRMMARHWREKTLTSTTPAPRALRFVEKSRVNAMKVGELPVMQSTLPDRLRLPVGLPRAQRPPKMNHARIQMNVTEPIRWDGTGTTSTRIALSREACEDAAIVDSLTSNHSRQDNISSRGTFARRGTRMMALAMFFLVASVTLMVVAMMGNWSTFDHRSVSPAAQPAPVLQPPFVVPTSASTVVVPTPASSVELPAVKGVHDSQLRPVSSAKDPPPLRGAVIPAMSTIRMKSAPPSVEVCTGVGIFQRCKKEPQPTAPVPIVPKKREDPFLRF